MLQQQLWTAMPSISNSYKERRYFLDIGEQLLNLKFGYETVEAAQRDHWKWLSLELSDYQTLRGFYCIFGPWQ